jgi:hypothetical protein
MLGRKLFLLLVVDKVNIVNVSVDGTVTNVIEYEVAVNEYVALLFDKEFVIVPEVHDLVSEIRIVPMQEVTAPPCQLRIHFQLQQAVKKKELPPEIEQYLNYILDSLAFEHGLSIATIRRVGGIYITAHGVMKRGFTEEQISSLERQFSVVKNEPYKGLYKAALQNTDSVARFMFLYSILFDVLNAAGQLDVDNHIRGLVVYDSSEDRKSTRNPNKMETIYTWLRNQVGHTQTDSEINQVNSLIQTKINVFSNIVKEAITLNT